jgi:hypothetical protein
METQEVHRALEAPDFVVNQDDGALLNTNRSALENYRLQRANARKNRQLFARVDKLEREVAFLMTQIKRV